MKRILTLSAILLSISAVAQNLTVQHLSSNHSMVRVDSPDRYILLPVQESAPEATISILTDLSLERKINVRLASDKVDYMVPLDISAFKGKNLILDVVTRRGPSATDTRNLTCWKELRTSSAFDSTNKEYYRPEYHFTPAYGWMNDPNGMVYKDGEWHLFYQYNPYGSIWGNMTWGHAVSTDLVNWEHRKPALLPDSLGMVFSGSAVVDGDRIAAIYTSAGKRQVQSLAFSLDGGESFQKYSGNPVLESRQRDFRDPKVFWYEPEGKWILVLAAGDHVEIFSSKNLAEWTFESSFGQGTGLHYGVWECPDLFELSDGNNSIWMLVCSLDSGYPRYSATQYFLGGFDGHRFTPNDSEVRLLDYGTDHYAAVSWRSAGRQKDNACLEEQLGLCK